ncbi:hypothetical protein TB1_032136 [Malus domestica]
MLTTKPLTRRELSHDFSQIFVERVARDCVQGIAIGVAAVVVLDKGVEFAQGHVTPMLNLAQLLCHVGIHVTFLNTEHIHCRLTQRRALSTRFPTLRFESILDDSHRIIHAPFPL